MWRPREMGLIVAQRELTFETAAGHRKANLKLGQPVRTAAAGDEGAWWCPIQFENLDPSGTIHAIPGVDQLHSILLALDFARKMIPHYAELAGGRAYFDDGELDCIFPQRATIDAHVSTSSEAFGALREVVDALEHESRPELKALHDKVAHLLRKYSLGKQPG